MINAKGERLFWGLFLLALVTRAILPILAPGSYNFAPAGAVSLFAGAYLPSLIPWGFALLLPVLSIFAGDLLISLSSSGEIPVFYPGWQYQYLSYLLIALIGMNLSSRLSLVRVVGASLFGSLVFFFISNFGVWTATTLYAHTAGGLVECFTLALPFFRNTALSDLLFCSLLFGIVRFAAGNWQLFQASIASSEPTAANL